ncbi:E3 ubiquitin-protein ligase TRIM39-like [Plectropomus leopardus]|uniref:E3 ubiquitin-protein ligase TRIM39-like n=1 Tax=Plectropomus leopardus TaxID=160734 RepID=UPI001C4ADC77|nr:E3 ubiquitin-protein ligase TRIM39-like [Plectropomus leopardus]
MAAAGTSLCEDQFLCSICLHVLTDPVSTPCGHNFCKKCITEHWDSNVLYDCPNCNRNFDTRPELQVNTFVSEMVADFRQSTQQKCSSSKQRAAEPGHVLCDICTGTKLKALKTCLVCSVSFCETHLEPHLIESHLKNHQLINPWEKPKRKKHKKRSKPLELFCRTHQTYVCTICHVSNHESHEVVPLEYERKKAKLQKTKAKINYVIKGRQEKIQEFKHSINTSKESMDRELADISRVFTKLRKTLERKEAKVIKKTEEKHRMTEKQAEGFIAELEQETSELKKRSAELKRLLDSKDHVYFLQNFPSTKSRFKKWTDVKVCPPLYKGDVQTAVAKMLKKETKRFLKETKLKTVQQYAVDVALDPDTANTQLILSEDGKQVHHSPLWNNLPDNPKRFRTGLCVLGRQFVSSGRFYFEVLVKGKPNWGLGVASESVDRKGRPTFSPKGGYWTIRLRRQNVYSVFTETLVDLSLKSKPEKVGVFVDYDEGLVSFYDVDAAALIFTYTGCSFMEKLFPVFLPGANQGGKNAVPLIICPVNPT